MPSAFDLLKQKTGQTSLVPKKSIFQLQQEAQSAEQEASKGLGRRFLSALPGGIAETLVKTPAKFLASVKEIPEVVLKGEATNKTYNIPLVGPTTSYQTDILRRPENLQGTTLGDVWSVAQVPLAGIETGVLASGAYKGAKAGYQGVKTGYQGARTLFTKTAERKVFNDALETILPKKMNPTALEQRIKQGTAQYKGFVTKTAEPVASKYEKEVANTIKGIVNSKNTPDRNVSLLKGEIKNISENQVVPNLKANPQIFNDSQIASVLRKIKPPTLLKSNTILQNTYDTVRNIAINIISKGKHNMEGLWESRKTLDSIAEQAKLLDFESRQVASKAVRDIRDGINKFIIDSIPDGQKLYGDLMKQESNMYRAIDMISENAPSKIISHPFLKQGLKWGKRAAIVGGSGYILGRILGLRNNSNQSADWNSSSNW